MAVAEKIHHMALMGVEYIFNSVNEHSKLTAR